MECNTTCIHFPCMRKECGNKQECKEYKSVIKEALEIIDKYKEEK